jgi:cardiolipin synthase
VGRDRIADARDLQRRHLITDPYFVAPRPVSEALAAAARGGVDVRVLLPGHNNWPWVGSLSRSGYRFLLEAGVRLFEWQGSMMHAKTSVCDGIWSRVGSSNLNMSSLLGNWEIDAAVLDEDLAAQLEALFIADLASSVEIVLPHTHWAVGGHPNRLDQLEREPPKAPLEPVGSLTQRLERELRGAMRGSSSGWRLADLMRAGSVFGTAIAGHRPLGREDRTLLGTVSAIMLVFALLFAFFPNVLGWTIAVLLGWVGIVTGLRAFVEARGARLEERGEGR